MPLHSAAAGIGTKVSEKGPSRLARSASPSWRSCGHEKETAVKTQDTLILQRIIALQTSGLYWNIRSKNPGHCGKHFPVVSRQKSAKIFENLWIRRFGCGGAALGDTLVPRLRAENLALPSPISSARALRSIAVPL